MSEYQEMMKRLAPLVLPAVPGRYRDYSGDEWTLRNDGTFEDMKGDTRPDSYNWMLVTIAPFTYIGA